MPFQWTNQAINYFKGKSDVPRYEVDVHASSRARKSAEAFIQQFLYFWNEVKIASASETQMRDLLNEIYGQQIAELGAFPRPGDLRSLMEAQIAQGRQFIDETITIPNGYYGDARQKSILTRLLSIGFAPMREYNIDAPGFPDALSLTWKKTENSYKFFSHTITLDTPDRRAIFPIAFRGEKRDFETVLRQGGAKRKVEVIAQVEGVRVGLDHTRAPWHPFSEQMADGSGRGDQMYFRKGAGDNCLYTVVSIATSPALALRFPLIDDRTIYNVPALPDGSPKPINDWTVPETAAARDSGVSSVEAHVHLKGDPVDTTIVHSFLGTETYLYAFRVTGNVVHTEYELDENYGGKGQRQCKERGARFVPIHNFLFGVKVRRVHLGLTHDHGIYAFVEECRYFDGAWHPIAKFSDPSDPDALKRFLNYHFSPRGGALTAEQVISLTAQVKSILSEFQAFRNLNQDQYEITHAPLKGEATVSSKIGGREIVNIEGILDWPLPPPAPDAMSLSANPNPLSSVFPRLSSELTYSLADEPILINGMKVIFDETVPVYPVTLVRKDAAQKVQEAQHD